MQKSDYEYRRSEVFAPNWSHILLIYSCSGYLVQFVSYENVGSNNSLGSG